MSFKKKLHDQDIEVIMGSLLRIGVMLAALVVLTGGIIYIFQNGSGYPHYKTFKGEPDSLKAIKDIFSGAGKFNSLSVIQLGLIILIATPIARVIFSIFGFLLEKDYLYTAITVIVLCVISFSLLSGIAG